MKKSENPLSKHIDQLSSVERSWMDIEPMLMSGGGAQKSEIDYEDQVKETHTLSFYETVAFTVNYVMGTGFLTIPWAFYQAGTALSLGTLTIMVVPAFLAILYVLEAMARGTVVFNDVSLYAASQSYESLENDQILKPWQSFIGLHNGKEDLSRSKSGGLVVGDKKIEITELCGVFMGRYGKICYTVVLSIYMYGMLWAYASVFSSSLLIYMDFGPAAYYFFLFLFACIVCPMSCVELTEQKSMQLTLAWCRVIMVVFMVTTVLLAFGNENEPFGEGTKNPDFFSNMVKFEGLHLILPVAVYANAFHHSIPTLSEPVADKRKLVSIFSTTLGCCFVSYAIIGCVLSVYFGGEISPSANTNWNAFGHFHHGVGPFISRLVAIYVIVFPALDVASAFPLNAVTLGNSLMAATYGTETPGRSVVVAFRLLAAVPPIIGASIVSDLGKITDYTGISGMLICFVFPALLGLSSEKYFFDRRISSQTAYSSILTHRYAAIALLLTSVAIFGYSISALLLHE